MKVDVRQIEILKARHGMTTKEMVQEAGIPRGTWCGVRRTKRANTSTIGKIANALKVDVLDIIIHEEA